MTILFGVKSTKIINIYYKFLIIQRITMTNRNHTVWKETPSMLPPLLSKITSCLALYIEIVDFYPTAALIRYAVYEVWYLMDQFIQAALKYTRRALSKKNIKACHGNDGRNSDQYDIHQAEFANLYHQINRGRCEPRNPSRTTDFCSSDFERT